jgi:hypothetical protein
MTERQPNGTFKIKTGTLFKSNKKLFYSNLLYNCNVVFYNIFPFRILNKLKRIKTICIDESYILYYNYSDFHKCINLY